MIHSESLQEKEQEDAEDILQWAEYLFKEQEALGPPKQHKLHGGTHLLP